MKTCPACGTKYSDDLSFCLQDGSRLAGGGPTNDLTNKPTEQFHPGTAERTDISTFETLPSQPVTAALPTAKQYRMSAVDPSSKMGCIVTVGQVSLGLLVVSLIGLGGFMYYKTGARSEIAQSRPEYANSSAPTGLNPNSTSNTMSVSPVNLSSNSQSTGSTSSSNSVNVAATPTATRKPSPTPAATQTAVVAKASPTPEPAPTATPDRPIPGRNIIAGGNLNGRALSLPKPPYPPAARAAGISGIVAVRVLVDEGGYVIAVEPINGHPLLRPAAAAAARQARFAPVQIAGQPVKLRGVLTYNFIP